MMRAPTPNEILAAIRKAESDLAKLPSKREFMAHSGMVEYHVLSHFPSWVEAVRAAGLDIQPGNVKLGRVSTGVGDGSSLDVEMGRLFEWRYRSEGES